MKLSFLVIAAILFSIASSKFFSAPYVWISACWFLVFLYAMLSSRRSLIKAVWFNIGIIILSFGLFEAYLWVRGPAEYRYEQNSTKETRWKKHDFLGQVPIENDQVKVKKYYGKELIWDTVYTIDPHGLRMSPPDKGGDDIRSILFFGGSFMFGWGLNDTETMPYQVGLKTNGNFRIYNFGVPAYGPNHMLSEIEHGLVKNIVKGTPTCAVYEALFDHVRRAAGIVASRNPNYILNENGDVVYQGRFDESDIVPLVVKEELRKSRIFRKITDRHRFINSDDIDLFVGIIAESRDSLERLYPGIKFHLLFWSGRYELKRVASKMDEIIPKLKAKGIPVHIIGDILQIDTRKKWNDLKISRLDGHPNAKANEMIAEYVVKEIIKK